MKGYKIATIVLSIVVLLETIFIIFVIGLGMQIIDQENECYYDICQMDTDNYSGWYYDDIGEVCYCYNGEKITNQKYLGS